jgi:hypothetical protein
MKQLILVISFGITLLLGCKEKTTQSTTPQAKQFALYLLQDSTLTATSTWSMSLDSMALSAEPLITQKDLKTYNWSNHTFTVQPAIDTLLRHMGMQGGKSSGVPFVAIVEKERIYLGAFWWAYSSSLSQVSYIYVGTFQPHQIEHQSSSSKPDLRSDQRIHDALKAAGILVE